MRQARRIGLVLVLALLGCQDDQILYSSPEGRYAVAFPAPPIPTETFVEGPGGPVTMHTNTATSPDAVYVVAWADYPPEAFQDLEQMFDQTRDGLVANLRGELVSEERLEVQGHPGRTLALRVAGSDTFLEARLIAVDGRLYQVAVVNSEGRIGATETVRFQDSFEILER